MKKIDRRKFLGTAAFAVAAAPTVAAARPSGGLSRPNILWLIADDLGDRDLGCYGHPSIRTENLDRLAGRGVRFDSAFVTTSSCSPSRASVFTGKYPHATGAEDLHVPLPEGQKILPAHLSALGYYTANVGKLHLGPHAAAQFDRVEDSLGAWQAVLEQRPDGKPFFLAVGFNDPHRPYAPGAIPDPTSPDNVLVPPYLADTPETRQDLAYYYDYVTRMDREIGRIVSRIDSLGLTGNTLVVFFSDNGMPFPRAKTSCYDSGVRVPMIVSRPGHLPQGQTSRALVSTVDLAPSTLALLGREAPDEMQGLDLSRLFLEPAADGREYVFTERNWHNIDDHIRSARDSRYKYIRNFFPRQMTPLASDLMSSPSYGSLLELRDLNRLTREQMRLFMVPRAGEELYDTRSDPWEFVNLAGDPRYAAELERLRAECERWTAETGDVPPEKRRKHNLDIFTRERYGKTVGEPEVWDYKPEI